MEFNKFLTYHNEQRTEYLDKIRLIDLEDNIFTLLTLHTTLSNYLINSDTDLFSIHFFLLFNNYMLGENESSVKLIKILINDDQRNILKQLTKQDSFYDIKQNTEKYLITNFKSLEIAAENIWSKKNNPNTDKFIFSTDYANDIDFAINEGFAIKISLSMIDFNNQTLFVKSFIHKDDFIHIEEMLEKFNSRTLKNKMKSIL